MTARELSESLYAIVCIVALIPNAWAADTPQVPTFPGAEGYGSVTRGGRGGKVVAVSNLNDSRAGSLRAVVEAEGPRMVVFRVSGTIKLADSLDIRNPYLTIAGQTARGDVPVGKTGAERRPRVIATTDGEIDDQCSMVRFLLYANEWGVEGIITSSSQYHSHGHNWAGDDWVQPYLNAYAKVYPNLVKHDPAYPTPEYLRGQGEELWQPRFTFHGFQYVELTGLPDAPGLNTVTGCVVHSATPAAGRFECSHRGINRLWRNALWSQKGNFLSVPTDCPQRDERLGWMGDAQVFLRTATYNMDAAAFFSKWMVDVQDAQTPEGVFPDTAPRLREDEDFIGLDGLGGAPGWADAGVIVPWTIWRVYNDRRIIELDPQVNGFKRFLIRPNTGGGLEYARAAYESIHGVIESRWQRQDDTFTLEVTIPANTQARVCIPCDKATEVREGQNPVEQVPGITSLGREGRFAMYDVPSGRYHFTSTYSG